MSISTAVLTRQRMDSAPPGEPRKLRLVKLGCECGECRTCGNREWMRRYRITHPRPLTGRPLNGGPGRDPHRVCSECSGPVAVTNKTGYCTECQKKRGYRGYRGGHIPRGFTDGGGI